MPYITKLQQIAPLAIKLDQSEVHAPDHDRWCKVSCTCGDQFAIGPNRIFGTKSLPEDCIKELNERLANDHYYHRVHENSYELHG